MPVSKSKAGNHVFFVTWLTLCDIQMVDTTQRICTQLPADKLSGDKFILFEKQSSSRCWCKWCLFVGGKKIICLDNNL